MGWQDDRTIGLIGYASAPTGVFKGQTYFNTTSNGAFVWDGSSWVSMSGGGGGGGDGIYGGNGALSGTTTVTMGANDLYFDTSGGGQIGIGTITPDASSLLHLDSVTQGFLPPRMTTAQKNAITTPATGLVVYDTTLNLLEFYDGSSWTGIGGGGDGIYSGSGSLSVATTVTMGANDLYFTTSGGQFAIGTITPDASSLFQIDSTTQGFLKPRMTTAQQGAITTPATGLEVYNTDDDTPNYNHSVDGWIPVGRYANKGATVNGGNAPIGNQHIVSSNVDGEINYAPFRWAETGGTAYMYGVNSSTLAIQSSNLGASSTNVRWLTLYFRGYLDHQYGKMRWTTGTNAGAKFQQGNLRVGFTATTGQGGIIVRNDGVDTYDLNASAMLELRSTEKGILPPKMTTVQRDLITAVSGLFLYDTTVNKLQYYNGTTWVDTGGIYGGSGSLISATTVTMGANDLTFDTTGGDILVNNNVAPDPVFLIDGATNTIGMGGNATLVEQLSIYNQNGSGNTTALGIYGNNATGTQKAVTISITAIATTNTALEIEASGSTSGNNYALLTNGGQVGIGTLTPDASALMEVNSITQGVLLPRMTEIQKNAISTPATGLMVFDTDYSRIEVYDGTAWTGIGIFAGNGTLPYSTTITSNNHRLILSDVATASSSLLTISKGSTPNFSNIVQTISTDGVTASAQMTGLYVQNTITGGATQQIGIKAKVEGWVVGGETASVIAQNGSGNLTLPANSDVGLLAGFTTTASNPNATAYGIYSKVESTSATTNIGGYFEASGGVTNNYALITGGGQVGIGTSSPNASAILQIDSTTQGFLPPRMSTVQMNAIASPLEGLIVYDLNTNQWMGWNKSAWVILG